MMSLLDAVPGNRLIGGTWLHVLNFGGIPDTAELVLESVDLDNTPYQTIKVWSPITSTTRTIEARQVACIIGSIQFPTLNRHRHLRVQPGTSRPSL